MRTNLDVDHSGQGREASFFPGMPYRLLPGCDPEEGDPGRSSPSPDPIKREDLPYKVELWDDAKAGVEQVLAITASASIGFAAFYGATREFPDRYITLRHKSSIISQWNGP
ncbi:MAG TPA: hypothetical protein VJ770_30035 [Stellaceae bacterium]|nr:hypothetical protein [Stellaceae bacterium]